MQEADALAKLMDLSFAVQLQTQPADVFPNDLQALFQNGTVLVDQNEIVHISDVMLDAQLFLDIMVEVVQHSQLYELAYL